MNIKLNAKGICNIVVQHVCLKNTVRFTPSDTQERAETWMLVLIQMQYRLRYDSVMKRTEYQSGRE